MQHVACVEYKSEITVFGPFPNQEDAQKFLDSHFNEESKNIGWWTEKIVSPNLFAEFLFAER